MEEVQRTPNLLIYVKASMHLTPVILETGINEIEASQTISNTHPQIHKLISDND